MPHSVFHSQAWIQRRWGQTGTNFLKKKKRNLKAKSTHIHLKQQSLVPRLKKTQKPQFSSARPYPGHVGYIDEVLCNLKLKDWARWFIMLYLIRWEKILNINLKINLRFSECGIKKRKVIFKWILKELISEGILVWMYKITSKIKEVQVITYPKMFSYETTENISCLLRTDIIWHLFKCFLINFASV